MKKRLMLIFLMGIVIFLTTSCRTQEKETEVYSFSGENEDITINNGLIIVTDDLEKFVGGDLTFKNGEPKNIRDYSEQFFFDKDGEEYTILSNITKVEGTTEGQHAPSELGSSSSEELFYGKDLDLIKKSLNFSLSGVSVNEEKFEYSLDLSVKKVF